MTVLLAKCPKWDGSNFLNVHNLSCFTHNIFISTSFVIKQHESFAVKKKVCVKIVPLQDCRSIERTSYAIATICWDSREANPGVTTWFQNQMYAQELNSNLPRWPKAIGVDARPAAGMLNINPSWSAGAANYLILPLVPPAPWITLVPPLLNFPHSPDFKS